MVLTFWHAGAGPDDNLPRRKLVHVTFATRSMAPFVVNWVRNARAAGTQRLLVAAFDEDAALAARGEAVPFVRLDKQGVAGSRYINTHSSQFRHMGRVKVSFIQRMIERGNTVVMSDADVVWLGDPRNVFSSHGLEAADILVSTDCINVQADAASAGGSLCNTRVNFNTGVLVVRPTAGARAFVALWLAKLDEGIANNVTWMRDQPCFNIVARTGLWNDEPPVANPDRLPTDRVLLMVAGNATKLGVLSPELFAGGHTYFMQGYRQNALSVHATFQYSDNEAFPYGKRGRFRQFGLWKVDSQEYTSGKFLKLADMPFTAVVEPEGQRAAATELLRVFFDADAAWRVRVRDGLALARVLGRTLILPRAYCYCDRSWSPLLRCRLQEVPTMAMPFECPLDHVVNVNVWERSGVSFRGPNFVPPAGVSSVKVTVTGRSSDTGVADQLSFFSDAGVLEILNTDAPLCALNADFYVPGHPVVNVTQNFHGFTNYLLEQRISFCEFTPGLPLRNATGGMVEKHCGAEEEAGIYKTPRRADLGHVRNRPDCPCEVGYRLPEKLPFVSGNTCA